MSAQRAWGFLQPTVTKLLLNSVLVSRQPDNMYAVALCDISGDSSWWPESTGGSVPCKPTVRHEIMHPSPSLRCQLPRSSNPCASPKCTFGPRKNRILLLRVENRVSPSRAATAGPSEINSRRVRAWLHERFDEMGDLTAAYLKPRERIAGGADHS